LAGFRGKIPGALRPLSEIVRILEGDKGHNLIELVVELIDIGAFMA